MQQGGSPYGALPPQQQQQLQQQMQQQQLQQQQAELTPFQMVAEAAPPISTRPPSLSSAPGGSGAGATVHPNYEELGTGDDPLGGPGDEGGSGGISGNRWPRQETLALLKIRSDMDAAFRDATLKGPLWEEVSRKLAELGYKRNAKKCKEKFENVHKYYKRTKEGRAGRQDGKSYRFFSQLEALHNTTVSSSSLISSPTGANMNPNLMVTSNAAPNVQTGARQVQQPMQISAPMPITTAPPPLPLPPSVSQQQTVLMHENPISAAVGAGIGFSSNTSSSSGSESDEEDDEATEEGPFSGKKRKRENESGRSKKMMAFFEGLMRQVMERQESMQQRFLEAIEKREQDRMIREEAWRRKEMSRLSREHELAAQERAAAASRDAAIISFLQKVSGQTVQIPPVSTNLTPVSTQPPTIQSPPPPPPPPPPSPPPPTSQVHQPQVQQQIQTKQIHTPPPPPQPQPLQQQQQQQLLQQQNTEIVRQQFQTPPSQPPLSSSEMMSLQLSDPQDGSGSVNLSLDLASSRWPKSEVHALIQLRSGLDSRYQESGPKGPLWEEISSGMRRLGYNRNAKRCKEKWENINKYFKKVKESNKKRPEDAKTCPYFHQLDALYRSKHNNNNDGGGASGGSGSGGSLPALTHSNPNTTPNPNPSPISMIAPPQSKMEGKNGNGGNGDQTNCGIGSNFFGESANATATGAGDNGGIMKKPEDIMKELMGQSNHNDYGNDPESDNMDEDDEEEEDDDDEDGNGQYRIQFQRQNNVSNGNGNGNGAPMQNTSGKASGSFLAMVR